MSDTNGSPPAALSGLASIVIPCCGMVEYTKLLVPSLLEHTRQPYELIFIDIGSLDGTADYLEGLAAGLRKTRVTVVRAETDLQINDACREALATAAGEYVVLLNNDTIVTDQWLNQLIGLTTSKVGAGVGLVGPMSNYAAPPQLVEVVPYRLACGEWSAEREAQSAEGWPCAPRSALHSPLSPALHSQRSALHSLHAFAEDWRDKHEGKWQHAERLGGFCLLIKREVLNKIGRELDEASDLGLFDTDILSAKARAAGWNLAICRDLFIHHFGTRTFAHGAGAV